MYSFGVRWGNLRFTPQQDEDENAALGFVALLLIVHTSYRSMLLFLLTPSRYSAIRSRRKNLHRIRVVLCFIPSGRAVSLAVFPATNTVATSGMSVAAVGRLIYP